MDSTASLDRPGSRTFDLEATLHRIAHWLPAQGPIKDFIHHNTLHAFQHLRFHDASSAASRLFGAKPYMPGEFYLDAYRAGRITESAFARALESAFPDVAARAAARARMLQSPLELPKFAGVARAGLRETWTARLGRGGLDRLSHPPLFRFVGGFVDQGLSIWRMPGANRFGLFAAVARLARQSWLPLKPLDSPAARELLGLPVDHAILAALARTVGREELYETYLLETLLSEPGWAGLVAVCEQEPGSLLSRRQVALRDLVALTLAVELGCIEKILGPGFAPLAAVHPEAVAAAAPDAIPARTEAEALLAVWQEAFEWSYYESVLGGLAAISAEPVPAPARLTARAFFCIDDRECSLRRHIEEVDPGIETFATAGFFGLDFMYRGAGDLVAGKHCPVPIKPKHLVVEEAAAGPDAERAWFWRKPVHLERHSNTFFRGWILSHALGFGAAVRLAASVFKPSLAPVSVAPLSTVSARARLRLARRDEARTDDGLWLGYSLTELADRVQGVLQSVGADDERWPSVIAFFAHGSSSANNPYFAAYNCGACAGRPGAPNARAFAEAANMPEVREILRHRGVSIPDSTWFVGALHDTSRDEVTYYDLERMPAALKARFDEFRRAVDVALERNAAERCRRFEVLPGDLRPEEALEQVRSRAVSLFEPRPEYNHATNAACVIGRRTVTEGLFLDRRAFLSSYDPNRDPSGDVLTAILSAVVPVTGGINLEYYFSRVDPTVYGAGSKLPHNVTALVGVSNGVEGDLLTGLPTQMTEIHDPVRMLLVVEHSPEVALEAARRNPRVFEWVENEWLRYACVDPSSHAIWVYQGGEMRKVDHLDPPRICWRSSLEAAWTGRENLPVGFVGPAGGRMP